MIRSFFESISFWVSIFIFKKPHRFPTINECLQWHIILAVSENGLYQPLIFHRCPHVSYSAWWFGTSILFFHILGTIIPTGFHISHSSQGPPRGMAGNYWCLEVLRSQCFAMALFTDGIRMSVRTIGYAACQVNLGGSTGLAHLSEAWCKQLAPNVVRILSNVDVKWYEGDVSCGQAARLSMSCAIIENVPGLVRHHDFR